MRWMSLVPIVLLLSACGTIYNSEVVSYRTVEVNPAPPTFVVVDEAPVDVTTTEVDYY